MLSVIPGSAARVPTLFNQALRSSLYKLVALAWSLMRQQYFLHRAGLTDDVRTISLSYFNENDSEDVTTPGFEPLFIHHVEPDTPCTPTPLAFQRVDLHLFLYTAFNKALRLILKILPWLQITARNELRRVFVMQTMPRAPVLKVLIAIARLKHSFN